jgi:voltage-gated potassium channel
VQTASRIVVATDRDDTSVLVTLTARRLAPLATLVASARESQNIGVLRQSGADVVIPTAESAGRMLGLSLTSPIAGHLVEDLLEPHHGLEILERPVLADEVGLSPDALAARSVMVLAVVRRGDVHRFDARSVSALEAGDRVVVISPVAAD